MKKVLTNYGLGFVLLLSCKIVFAAEPRVEITSFASAGVRTTAAEVCGKVTGLTSQGIVRLIVDEKSERPGVYNVLVDPDGSFCSVVVTYRGKVSASLRGVLPIQVSEATLSESSSR